MKIAFLHMTMGLIDRGSEVSTALYASELSKKHEVLVVQSGPVARSLSYKAKRLYPLSIAPPIEPGNLIDKVLFRLSLNASSLKTRQFTQASLVALRKFKPDIIFATNGHNQVTIVKRSMPQAKVVVIGHAGIGHDDLNNLRAQPDLFLAVSKQAEMWASTHKQGTTVVSQINNPFDPKLYGSPKRQSQNLPRPVVIVVGALTAYKNIDIALKACQKLGVSLLLVGDGEERDKIQDILSSYLCEFRWIKHVTPGDIPAYYQSADAFCFVPDKQEAFGRVYLEAMAAGLPIVASADPIRQGLVGKQGYFADPEDVSSVVQALSQALKSPKLKYTSELKDYLLKNVISKLEQELYAITK